MKVQMSSPQWRGFPPMPKGHFSSLERREFSPIRGGHFLTSNLRGFASIRESHLSFYEWRVLGLKLAPWLPIAL